MTLGIGLVCYGAWGRMHAAAIARLLGVSLATIVENGDASAAAAANDYSGVPVLRSLDALLARGDVCQPRNGAFFLPAPDRARRLIEQ